MLLDTVVFFRVEVFLEFALLAMAFAVGFVWLAFAVKRTEKLVYFMFIYRKHAVLVVEKYILYICLPRVRINEPAEPLKVYWETQRTSTLHYHNYIGR